MQRLTGAVIKLPEQVDDFNFLKQSKTFLIQGTSSGEDTSVHIIGSFYSIQVINNFYFCFDQV